MAEILGVLYQSDKLTAAQREGNRDADWIGEKKKKKESDVK